MSIVWRITLLRASCFEARRLSTTLIANMTRETQSAGGVVINRNGMVLVVNQRGNSWSLPKGHVEEGETPLQAAIREIEEESGVTDLEFVKELGTYQRFKLGVQSEDDTSELKTITIFLFRTKSDFLMPSDPDNPQARWVERDQVAELLTHCKDKDFYSRVMREHRDLDL